MRHHLALPISLGIFLFALRAFAEDPVAPPPQDPPPPPAPQKTESPEVHVIGDKADSLQKIPGSGTLIPHKEIDRAQPYDASEMLRRVPGVNVSQQEGGGLRLDMGVHGLDPGRSRNVLVLEDGVPIAVNPYSEADLYYLPQIERMRGIEVVKGSGSILFGPQTIGGVVNFLTLAPPSSELTAVELDYGQRNYAKVLALHGDTVGSARYIVQAFHTRGDGYRDENFNATDAFGKIAFDTSSKGEATVKVGFHDDATRSDDVGLTRAMFQRDPDTPTLAPADHIDQQRYDVSLTHEQHFSRNTTLKTLIYAYETKRIWNREDFDRTPIAGTPYDHVVGDTSFPNGGIYFRSTDAVLDRTYDVAAIEPRLQTRGETFGVGHTLDVGARILAESAHYKQYSGDTPWAQTGSLDYEFQHGTYGFAAYTQDRLAFKDWLLVTPGIRFEHAELSSAVLRQGTSTGVANVNIPSNGSAGGLIPGIGIIAGSRDVHAFAGSYVGYAPPRITSPINPKGGSVSELDSERSINYEIGGRLTLRKKFHLEATGFLLDFDNQVVQNGSSDGSGDELVNGGKTRHYGIEGEARLDLGNWMKLNTDVELATRFTLARAFFVGGINDGNMLPYSPPANLVTTLAADRALGPGRLGGEVAWTFVAPQFSDASDTRAEDATGQTGLIPAYHLFDLSARYKHTPTGLTGKVTIKGLTNDPYIAARRPEGIQAAGFREIIFGLRWESAHGPL
jgi:Fe(3+) dicitrate transport protein